jgi:hypothetical protein|tara:strand:- start:208 stop:501 length:294 start_codon:yes stop_codon:yes gene_type:complete
MPEPTRDDILLEAMQCITHDRAATHGDAEDSFQTIADVWSWWLSNRPLSPLTAADVAMMMALFKIGRIAGNSTHEDNYIDLAGYAALAGEISMMGDR